MASKRCHGKRVEKRTRIPKHPSSANNTSPTASGEMDATRPTTNTTLTTDIHPRAFHTAFLSKLAHLTRRLTPLISVATGKPHPSFPRTILAYHLLSSTDLDSIAAHYHQTILTVRESHEYPMRIPPWVDTSGRPVLNIPVETKRRRIGRFIGLRGCDSPTTR